MKRVGVGFWHHQPEAQLPWWGGKEPWGALGAGTPLWCPWAGQVQSWPKGLRALEGLSEIRGKAGVETLNPAWAVPHTHYLG